MSLPRARSGRSKTLTLACCLLVGALCGLALFNGSKWLLAEHYRNVAGELMTQYGILPEVCRMARLGGWTLDAYAARNCSIALGEGTGLLRRG